VKEKIVLMRLGCDFFPESIKNKIKVAKCFRSNKASFVVKAFERVEREMKFNFNKDEKYFPHKFVIQQHSLPKATQT
jgi:hypothetical protein